jgi:Family of unknown function (DUF6236)
MRGIVISPVKITGKNSMSVNGSIDPLKLRQYLLYWDKIDFPQSNVIRFGETPEIKYLKDAGILKQTNVGIHLNGELTELYLKSQLKALEINNKNKKGSWTLGQENIELVLPKGDSVVDRGVEVELYNSLPVPSEEVSLEDILNFKEKRKDELLYFRSLMDNMYLELLDSADSERAINVYIQRLQKGIMELDQVMKESKLSKFKGSVKIQFDLKEALINTFIGATGGTAIGFPDAGAALGFASSFINITSEMSLKPKEIPSELKDYAYLYYSSKELK